MEMQPSEEAEAWAERQSQSQLGLNEEALTGSVSEQQTLPAY